MCTDRRLYKGQPYPFTKLPLEVPKHRKETISLLPLSLTINHGDYIKVVHAESIRKNGHSYRRTCRTVSAYHPFHPKKSLD
jgi:hypothetical protein